MENGEEAKVTCKCGNANKDKEILLNVRSVKYGTMQNATEYQKKNTKCAECKQGKERIKETRMVRANSLEENKTKENREINAGNEQTKMVEKNIEKAEVKEIKYWRDGGQHIFSTCLLPACPCC